MSVKSTTLRVENLEISNFILYPNPVKNFIQLTSVTEKIEKVEKVEIYNLLGMLIKTITENTNKINLSNLSKGNYLLKVFGEKSSFNKIIIKE